MRVSYYAVLNKAQAVKPYRQEEKLLPPGAIFKAKDGDIEINRLLKINAIRKLDKSEIPSESLSNPDIIVVLD